MPESTEVERIAKQRVGQDIFRASLDDYWGGRCPITGIGPRAPAREPHEALGRLHTDEQRLDVYNGFLLAVHLDAAFDAALMTFDEEGKVILSPKLSDKATALLKLGVDSIQARGGA